MMRADIPAALAGDIPAGPAPPARLLSLALIVPIAAEWPAPGLLVSYMAREAAVKKYTQSCWPSRLPTGLASQAGHVETNVPQLALIMRSAAAD